MSKKMAEFRRGWRSLLAAAIGNGSGLSGLAFYTFGVFVLPLVAAFGWTRGEVSIAASFLIIGTAITAPLVGSMIDRFGARRVGLISMVALAFGYALLTTIDGTIGTFYAAWLGLSLIGGGTTPVVWTRTVNIWFDRGRGLALGLALAGSGLAGVFAPLLVTKVIAAYGWQGGYLAIGAFILVVSTPLIALLLQERPVAGGALPAGIGSADTAAEQTTPLPGLELAQALRDLAFWKIAVGFFLVSAVIAALIINLIPLLVDRGLDASKAAGIAGVMGVAVLVGRVVIGMLLDHLPSSLVAAVVLGLCALGCFVLSLPDAPLWVVGVSVLSLGLAAAAEVDLVAYLSSRFFGMRAYGKVYGWQLTSFYLGAAVGPLAAGMAYDRFGSYLPTLYFASAALLFGALVTATLGKPRFVHED
ncbi:MAG: MFS transporter [Gammaproteobacteria bacterium]|nr:MFS transporter [Gammaproteobacteria bacterium]